jgi:hypothetical protein
VFKAACEEKAPGAAFLKLYRIRETYKSSDKVRCDKRGRTDMHYACLYGIDFKWLPSSVTRMLYPADGPTTHMDRMILDCQRWLQSRKSHPRLSRNVDGNTPLHLAIESDQPLTTIHQLIKMGGDPEERNHAGTSAYDLVHERVNQEKRALPRNTESTKPSNAREILDLFVYLREERLRALAVRLGEAPNPVSIPSFFAELFDKARIHDPKLIEVYVTKLTANGLDSAERLAKVPLDVLEGMGVRYGDAVEFIAVSHRMNLPVVRVAETGQVLDPAKRTVMISYQWGTQATAIEVRRQLLSTEQFNVILDVEGIKGSLLKWMESSIQLSDALIMLIGSGYEKSQNCEREACRAHELGKKLVPIFIEPGYVPQGWLATLRAGLIHYDGATNEALEESLRTILSREFT